MRDEIAASLLDLEQEENANSLKARFCFNSGLEVFKGHFPGEPLLPGIMQIEMVRLAVEAFHKAQYDIVRIVRAKFARAVVPDETIHLTASIHPENGEFRIKASLFVGNETAAAISLVLREAAGS